MKTSNKLILAATIVIFAYLVVSDFALKAEYATGNYQKEHYAMDHIALKNFTTIQNNAGNIIDVEIIRGDKFEVFIREEVKDRVTISQKNDTVFMDTKGQPEYSMYGAIKIKCPYFNTLITREYELMAFGTKIARSEMSLPVEQIIATEPVVDGAPIFMHPGEVGGTRHLAAAQFVYDQRDAIALVASQDGHFTIFAWSPQLQMVHSHRIDILLL